MPTSRRRPDVTADEKAKFLAVCEEIRDEEPQLSVRAYMYRTWSRQSVYLHGELSTKGVNEETIQRLILEFRRAGLIPYESIIDGTRSTTFAEGGWDDLDEARRSLSDPLRDLMESYELSIWAPQGKRVELLSEKEALAVIVERVAREYQVNTTSCKGFSSESLFYEVAKRTVRIGRPTVFLILTDHDRAGYNMTDHAERVITRLVELVCDQYGCETPALEFVRVGLNAEQVERYQVMTRDPKPNEHAGMLNYIAECAEVDALRSEQIEEIIREGIEAQLDMDILATTREQEAEDIETLRRELGD